MTRRRAPVIVVALVAALAACGVPTHDTAKKVDADDVPFQLLEQDRGGAAAAEPGEEDVVVSFVRDDRLVAAPRRLPRPTPARLLALLREGPTRAEAASGARSALPETGGVRSVTVAGGTATVDLGRRFTELSSGEQLLALAQIVYTLTSRPGIGQVRFTLLGETTEVPRANGSLTSNRVSRDDYAALAPVG